MCIPGCGCRETCFGTGVAMRVLVACEFSGIVRDAFAACGQDAWSCDLLPTERPGQHIQGDVLSILNDGWDLMIAHPPCTHLACSGAAWMKEKRKDGRQKEGIDLFMAFTKTNIPQWCIENPVGIMSTFWRKPDQIIHPYYFGDSYQKKTCLWLHGLHVLQHYVENDWFVTKTHVDKGEMIRYDSGKVHSKWYADTFRLPPVERAKERSRTFQGIADAMAKQ